MSARYEVGELVDVTIRGARVVRHDASPVDEPAYIVVKPPSVTDEIEVPLPWTGVTVRRAVPADGVPQAGDIWADRFDARYFARAGLQEKVVLVPASMTTYSQIDWQGLHAGAEGPIRLVYREGWSPQPAAPVDVQVDEPALVDERAAIVAGYRALADFLEAHPDLPVDYTPGVTLPVSAHHAGDEAAFSELRRIAGILGVEPDLRDEPGASHPHANRRFDGVLYHAYVVTEAYRRGYMPVEPEPMVDGSPSDLDVPVDGPILDAGGYLPCGCLGTASEHSCGDEAEVELDGDVDEDCANEWHFGADRPRLGPCPACGAFAPSTPDGGDQS